jgi:hypothetical protein
LFRPSPSRAVRALPSVALGAGTSKIGAVLASAVVMTSAGFARAQGLRLRGDAFAQTPSPVGLVVLRGEDRRKPWIDAETVTWIGGGGEAGPIARSAGGVSAPDGITGDVLTLSVRMRDVTTGSEVRAGRMLVTMGAVRPLHLDGARGLARLPSGTVFEAFGGVPVVPRFGYRTFDWAGGGRVAQAFRDALVIGGSYQQRRTDGRPADEELGLDAAFTPSSSITAAGRASYDLVNVGLTDALGSVSYQRTAVRIEAFTTHRTPGRLLPSTSLFSVLGDFAATASGATVRWRAFPRLELVASGSAQVQGAEWGGQGLGRATLGLDDAFDGTAGLEVRRIDVGSARWNGARVVLSLPLRPRWRVGTEIELVRPEPRTADTRDRGELWPWALASVAYRFTSGWDVAAAVEASGGPEDRRSAAALARLSWAWAEPARGAPGAGAAGAARGTGSR